MASKYEKGDLITSIDDLMKQEVVYFHHKVSNFGWFQNWSLHFVKLQIDRKALRYAIKKSESQKEISTEDTIEDLKERKIIKGKYPIEVWHYNRLYQEYLKHHYQCPTCSKPLDEKYKTYSSLVKCTECGEIIDWGKLTRLYID